jgi:hypothetical protein
MSDDFGTVSARRGERAREIEVLRQQYRGHRETLTRLISDAPTEHLATEYQRLIGSIDMSLSKLDELEGKPSENPTLRQNTFAADRPLVSPRSSGGAEPIYEPAPQRATPNSPMRVAIIIIAGLLVLGAIAWLILRASGDRRAAGPITATTATQPITEGGSDTVAAPAPVTPAPAPAGVLKVTPVVADYGTIHRGTRAVRQFEVANATAQPMTITVARSQCRCLYYDYTGKVPAKGKDTITVTVDGAKAKPGVLNETLEVAAKGVPAATTTIGVRAEIK